MFKAMIIAGLGGFIGTCLRFLTGKLAHVITGFRPSRGVRSPSILSAVS